MSDITSAEAIASTLGWMGQKPDALSGEMTDALAALGTRYAREGRQVEFAATLLQFYVVATARPVLHGTDEDVFALSSKVRQDYYCEVMKFRRAILQDIGRKG